MTRFRARFRIGAPSQTGSGVLTIRGINTFAWTYRNRGLTPRWARR